MQERAEVLREQLDFAYEERDRQIEELLVSIRQSRDALTGIYRQDMSKLQDFGFTVEHEKAQSDRQLVDLRMRQTERKEQKLARKHFNDRKRAEDFPRCVFHPLFVVHSSPAVQCSP